MQHRKLAIDKKPDHSKFNSKLFAKSILKLEINIVIQKDYLN
jgi:hypothetical protein